VSSSRPWRVRAATRHFLSPAGASTHKTGSLILCLPLKRFLTWHHGTRLLRKPERKELKEEPKRPFSSCVPEPVTRSWLAHSLRSSVCYAERWECDDASANFLQKKNVVVSPYTFLPVPRSEPPLYTRSPQVLQGCVDSSTLLFIRVSHRRRGRLYPFLKRYMTETGW